jgi:hypothetical protein
VLCERSQEQTRLEAAAKAEAAHFFRVQKKLSKNVHSIFRHKKMCRKCRNCRRVKKQQRQFKMRMV